jgi:hypothetical protein
MDFIAMLRKRHSTNGEYHHEDAHAADPAYGRLI